MSFEEIADEFGFEVINGEVFFDDEESAEEFRGDASKEGLLLIMVINDDTGAYSVREQ